MGSIKLFPKAPVMERMISLHEDGGIELSLQQEGYFSVEIPKSYSLEQSLSLLSLGDEQLQERGSTKNQYIFHFTHKGKVDPEELRYFSNTSPLFKAMNFFSLLYHPVSGGTIHEQNLEYIKTGLLHLVTQGFEVAQPSDSKSTTTPTKRGIQITDGYKRDGKGLSITGKKMDNSALLVIEQFRNVSCDYIFTMRNTQNKQKKAI